jgi:site-specific recombinase XerD
MAEWSIATVLKTKHPFSPPFERSFSSATPECVCVLLRFFCKGYYMTDVREAAEDYLKDCENRKLAYKTLHWYETRLERFLKWCEQRNYQLRDIKSKRIYEFIAEMEGLSPQTHKGYVQVIKGWLNWCGRDDDYEDEVSQKNINKIEMPKVPKSDITIFSADEIRKLYEACRREESPQLQAKSKAIISVMLDTGIRASEVCFDSVRPQEKTGLRVDMVDLSVHDPFIEVYGKGNKPRAISLGERARRDLRAYITRHRGSSHRHNYVFIGRGGEPMTVRGLEALLHRLGSMAGIADIHPHKFRHTFAVNYLIQSGKAAEGAGLVKLMKILGHTDIRTTMIYLRALEDRADNGFSVLDNM